MLPRARPQAGVTEAAKSTLSCSRAPLALGAERKATYRFISTQLLPKANASHPAPSSAPELPLGAIQTGEPGASPLDQWEAVTVEVRVCGAGLARDSRHTKFTVRLSEATPSLTPVLGSHHKGGDTSRGPAAASWSMDRGPAERLVPLGEGRGFLRDLCPGLHPTLSLTPPSLRPFGT